MTTSHGSSHTLTLPWVEEATRGFVFVDDLREAISLAMASGLGLLFSGAGGHAKSEFLANVLDAITGEETFIKSFGQGTSPEELFGGLDFDALYRAEGACLQFNPELSFLARKKVIFEEIFDASPRVLTFLKDTLTRRRLSNGHQSFNLQTLILCVATNKSPQEIAKLGPEVEALIQRFPIQLDVRWPSYGEDDFLKMFVAVEEFADAGSTGITLADVEATQARTERVTVSQSVSRMLARICAELLRDRVPMSPRTAMMASRLAQAAAVINDRDHVVPDDLAVVAYLPGAHAHKAEILRMIAENKAEFEAEMSLEALDQRFRLACGGLTIDFGAHALMVTLSTLETILHEVAGMRTGSSQVERRRQLIASIRDNIGQGNLMLEELTADERIEVHEARLREISARIREIDRMLGHNRITTDERTNLLLEAMQFETEVNGMRLHEDLTGLAEAVKSQIKVVLIKQ